MASRPEHVAPPEMFYNDEEAVKYANNSRMIKIQTRMSERAIELLNLPSRPCYILDVGCGSGLSGEALSEKGHHWVGIDISPSMLGVAAQRGVEGDLIENDMGQGVNFRPGTFDGCISISALQWLCNADKKSHVPYQRLKVFFQSLYASLAKGARAIFQLYPENPEAMELITSAAMRSGFSGGLVVDFPNSTKAKKMYLCLFAGDPGSVTLPEAATGDAAMDEEGDEEGTKPEPTTVLFSKPSDKDKRRVRRKKGTRVVKGRQWVLQKKDRRRAQGKHVAAESSYTARKRNKPRF